MHLSFQKGGGAFVLSLAGDRITLCSTVPSAPGSRLDGVLAGGDALRVKVASCRRRASPAPAFTIEGRLIDTTRDARDAIAALCDAARQPDEPDRGGKAAGEQRGDGDLAPTGLGGADHAERAALADAEEAAR